MRWAGERVHDLGWRLALILTLAASAPFDIYIGHDASGWLGGAWQISAVLLGFVVALVVFLLQAAGSQSLRADATYRALVASSGVVWPVTSVLVFLIQTALIERFSNSKVPTAAWLDTWALAFFVVQLVSFGVVFVRLLALVSPAGVARVMQTALSTGIRRSVEELFVAARADDLLDAACRENGIERSAMARSARPITGDRAGFLDDVDMRLPEFLRVRGCGDVQLYSIRLGAHLTRATRIAQASKDSLVGARVVRRGIWVRRTPRATADWLELLKEAIDLSRRALADGAMRDFDTALDVVIAGLSELPRAYHVYGKEYGRTTAGRPFALTEEDTLINELVRLTRDVFASANSDAAMRVPSIPYRMFQAGVEERAPYLLSQAVTLWRHQIRAVRNISEPALIKGVIDGIDSLNWWLVSDLTRRIADPLQPVSGRRGIARALALLFDFEADMSRAFIVADDIDSFRAVREHSTLWPISWDPERDLDSAQIELAGATEPADQEDARAAVEATHDSVELHDALVQARDDNAFLVGAWLAWQYKTGQVTEAVWGRFSGFFSDEYSGEGPAGGWLDRLTDLRGVSERLSEWEMSNREIRGPSAYVGPTGSSIAMFWATLLLLRRTQPPTAPNLEGVAAIEGVVIELTQNMDSIETDSARWESVVGADLAGKVDALRRSAEEARDTTRRAAAARHAATPPSAALMHDFAELSWSSFVRRNHLRKRLQDAGALETPERADAFRRDAFGLVLDKRLFLTETAHFFGSDREAYGRAAADDEQRRTYEVLVAQASDAPPAETAVAAVVAAIGRMRAAGRTPHVMLMPHYYRLRTLLVANPAFRWSQGPAPEELGFLADIPLMDIGPQDGGYLVVADLSASVQVRELRRPGQQRPLRTEVRPIDRARAEQMVDGGRIAVRPGQTRESVVQTLIDFHVEAYVDLDLRFGRNPAAMPGVAYKVRVSA